MRLVFALWPDAGIRGRIGMAAAALDLPGSARRVPSENYHLTLVFVGETTQTQLDALVEIGSYLQGSACTVRFDAYDYWPESQSAVAVARQTPAALGKLRNRLLGTLANCDAAPKISGPGASLRAHVTLARKVAQAPVLQAMSPFDWRAQSFSLIRSDTSRRHRAYTVVKTWPLLDETLKT